MQILWLELIDQFPSLPSLDSYGTHNIVSVLGQSLNLLSSILTILLTCPSSDISLWYSNDTFLTVLCLLIQLVYRRKAQVLNDLLCREPVGDPESTRGSLSQCLDHIKVWLEQWL